MNKHRGGGDGRFWQLPQWLADIIAENEKWRKEHEKRHEQWEKKYERDMKKSNAELKLLNITLLEHSEKLFENGSQVKRLRKMVEELWGKK